jgi:uncharacterized protein YjbI with pentapeptide repeats
VFIKTIRRANELVKKSPKIPLPPRVEERFENRNEAIASDLESNTEYDQIYFQSGIPKDLVSTNSVFTECSLSILELDSVDLQKSRINESFLTLREINILDAHNSRWRDSTISQGKIVSANFSGSDLSGILFRDLRFGYLNLVQSNLSDVLFMNCKFDTLDLAGSKLDRVAFLDSHVSEVDLRDVHAKNFNITGLNFEILNGLNGLRNSFVSGTQLIQISMVLANELEIKVLD